MPRKYHRKVPGANAFLGASVSKELVAAVHRQAIEDERPVSQIVSDALRVGLLDLKWLKAEDRATP